MRRLLVLLLLLSITACAGQSVNETSGMEVSVALRNMHRCSRISPEINVSGYPKNTAFFTVRLIDIENTKAMHGGGTWDNDHSGIIPEGALMHYYRGACPPQGSVRSYKYVVTAHDADKHPLTKAQYIFEQD